MLLKIPENRIAITEYLEQVDEDTFIDEFVVPFFTSFGFQVYRINTHGGGEHGKDIIFSRYVSLFLDTEYVAVQAKAQPANASNVSNFASQLDRALKVPFPSKSGQGDLLPNYAVFINARRHTNEANEEFPKLLDKPQYVRILSQENVCDLIMNSGIGPETLISRLSQSNSSTMSEEDKRVYDVLMSNEPQAIDHLLDHQLQLICHKISPLLKEMIIDTINLRWRQDPSWEGTIKPMMWFNSYFDFFSERQYPYLLDVIRELTSSTPSFKAESDTFSIVSKVTPQMLAPQAKEFIELCGELALGPTRKNLQLVSQKLRELKKSGLVLDSGLRKLMDDIIKLSQPHSLGDDEYRQLHQEIFQSLYPERRTSR